MPEPVTVWRVRLQRGDVRDYEGTLRLDDDALVFEDRASAGQTRLELSVIHSARRVRGSPVLLVAHDDQGERVQTAFYFSQPPPLEMPPLGSTRASPMGRPSKRRHQRKNVSYLTTRSGGMKQTIEAWVEEIRARTSH